MKCEDYGEYKVVILETPDDNPDETLRSLDADTLIFVSMHGYTGDDIPPSRFLVKNFENSFENHLMWEGLLDAEEQGEYIAKCCRKFWETGKQMVIENYAFQQDEPFYDYSK